MTSIKGNTGGFSYGQQKAFQKKSLKPVEKPVFDFNNSGDIA